MSARTGTGTPGDAPSASVLRRRARSAVARSAGGDRTRLVLLGTVLLAGGTLVALVGYGELGAAWAARPLLDPVVVDLLGAEPLLTRVLAIVAGVLLLLLGLTWTARSLRPERRPDLVLDRGPATAITVSSAAAADALGSLAATLPGVGRAQARLVGSEDAPAARLTLWLTDDADVRDVLERLVDEVLAPTRESLGMAALPVAVRLELDHAATGPRVA